MNILLITLSFIKNDIIIIAIAIIYDTTFFFALSFFLNIGTFSVSAGAYNDIIIIANVSTIIEKINWLLKSGRIIHLLIITLPQYNNEVPKIQPICVFKCTPPETNLYGNIITNEISAYLKIPSNPAIINNRNILGNSPIISSNPYFITSALSSSTSGIFALILFINLSQILSIIGSHLFLDAIIYQK